MVGRVYSEDLQHFSAESSGLRLSRGPGIERPRKLKHAARAYLGTVA